MNKYVRSIYFDSIVNNHQTLRFTNIGDDTIFDLNR